MFLSFSFLNLETLICAHLHELEYVFGTRGLEPEQIVSTTLRHMILSDLWHLIKIWDGPAPRAIFRNLNFLAVFGCHGLKTLLTFDVAQCLLQLEHLWVECCSGSERVIELPSGETETNKVLVLPKLKGIVLDYLPQLTGFYSSTIESSTIDHIECPSLEHLYVKDCPQFSTSVSDFHSRNPVQLRHYKHFIPVSERRSFETMGEPQNQSNPLSRSKLIGRCIVSCIFVFLTHLALSLIPRFFSAFSFLTQLALSALLVLVIVGFGGWCRRTLLRAKASALSFSSTFSSFGDFTSLLSDQLCRN